MIVSKSPLLLTSISLFIVVQAIGIGQVQILSPNGGEVFQQQDSIAIIWSSPIDTATVSIELSSDGGKSWERIADSTSEKKVWVQTPNLNSSNCLAKVTLNMKQACVPQLLHTLPIDSGYVTYVSFSSDDRLIATTGWDKKIRIWDVVSGKLLRTLKGHKENTLFSTFSIDGSELTTISLDEIFLWDVYTGIVKYSPSIGRSWSASYSPDGRHIAFGTDDGIIQILDRSSQQVEVSIPTHNEAIRLLYYSSDGSHIITCSTDRTAAIVDVEEEIPLQWFEHHSNPDPNQNPVINIVNDIQLSSSTNTVITGGFNGLVKYWDVNTEELLYTGKYHDGYYVSDLDLSPEENLLLSSGYDGTTQIIDFNSREPIAEIRADTGWVVRASHNHRGDIIAIAKWNEATLWKLNFSTQDISDNEWSIVSPAIDSKKRR